MVDSQLEEPLKEEPASAPGEETDVGSEAEGQVDDAEMGEVSSEAEGEGSEGEDEKVVFDEKQQAVFDAAISGKVAKTHEEKRRADDAEAKLAALQGTLPETKAPEVPPVPNLEDFYDKPDEYQKAVTDRDEALKAHTVWETGQEAQAIAARQTTERQEQEAVQAQDKMVAAYLETAKTFKITEEQTLKDTSAVGSVIPPGLIQDFISADKHGPLIIRHLAANLVEAENLASMSPMAAAIHIENVIRPKLASVKPGTKAPAPADIVMQGKVPKNNDFPNSKGATFE